jgi:hypothetical protein
VPIRFPPDPNQAGATIGEVDLVALVAEAAQETDLGEELAPGLDVVETSLDQP